jgi:hypothetical protein
VVTVSGKIEADAFGQKKPCILEIANNKVFPDSSVSVTYELFKPNGERVGKSIPAKGQVTGQAPIVLLPPILLPPAVSPFDVLAYVNGLTLQIEYLLAITGDKAQLAEINPPAGAVPFPLVEFDGSKRVNTVLPVAFLAARHGKAIEFYWVLNRNSAPIAKSAELKAHVLPIKDGDSRLPTPHVIQAPDNRELNLNNFEGDAVIKLAPWFGATLGQRVWLQCVAVLENGTPRTINLLSSHRLTAIEVANGFADIALPRSELSTLRNDSVFSVEAKVGFSGDTDILKATPLPVLKLNLRNINIVSGSENWEAVAIQQFPLNRAVQLNSGITVLLTHPGTHPVGPLGSLFTYQTNGQLVPSFGNRTLIARAGASFSLLFNGKTKKITADIRTDNYSGTKILFKDARGETIDTQNIPGGAIPSFFKLSYSSQSGKEISELAITVPPEMIGHIWMDNITWGK